MTTMKAIDIKGGKGPREALFMDANTPKPTAGPGQAIVRVKAFGVNRLDIIQREGAYPVPPQAPKTLGVEFSGVIESLGPKNQDRGDADADAGAGVTGSLKPGDAVLGLAYGGAYAEYIAVSAKMLLHKPARMSFEQAAAVPEAWITATQALHLVLGFVEGKSILWHAGASGVSIAGIQLSQAAGASHVFATAGSVDKCAFVTRELGATAAFNYKTTDWVGAIKERTGGKGVDYIVDFVGADYFAKNLDLVARDGRIVLLGLLSGGKVPEADMSPILFKRVRIEGSTLRSRDEAYQGRLRDRLETYCPRFDEGSFKIIVDKVLPWEDIQEAHKLMETAQNTGKIVCTVS